MKLDVMTFNLRLDTPSDGTQRYLYRRTDLLPYLQEQPIDIFAFQEVLPSMLHDLMDTLPNYQFVGSSRSEGAEAVPLAVNQNRFTILQHETIWLSHTPHQCSKLKESMYPRIATIARIENIIEKQQFLVMNVHLDYNGEVVINQQISILFEYVKNQYPHHLPRILLGDFNQHPHQLVHQTIAQAGFLSNHPQECSHHLTFHGYSKQTKGYPIDYIYYHHPFQLLESLIDHTIGKETYLSDHYPVLASFLL